jgi:hypothetical protein
MVLFIRRSSLNSGFARKLNASKAIAVASTEKTEGIPISILLPHLGARKSIVLTEVVLRVFQTICNSTVTGSHPSMMIKSSLSKADLKNDVTALL